MSRPTIREHDGPAPPRAAPARAPELNGAHLPERSVSRVMLLERAQVLLQVLFERCLHLRPSSPRVYRDRGSEAVAVTTSGLPASPVWTSLGKLNLISDLTLLFTAIWVSSDASQLGALRTAPVAFGVFASSAWVMLTAASWRYAPGSYKRPFVDDAALASVSVIVVTAALAFLDLVVGPAAGLPRPNRFIELLWPAALATRFIIFRPIAVRQGPADEVLVVGGGESARATAEALEKCGLQVVGYVYFPSPAEPDVNGAPALGAPPDLESVLRKTPVHEVYIAGDAFTQSAVMQAAITVCEQLGVSFALPLCSFRLERAWPMIDGRAVTDGYVHYHLVEWHPYQRALKRLLDVFISAAALFALLPVFGLVAMLIKLTSPGPVFFKQVRAGLHGRPFEMLKFRSMVMNAEALKPTLELHNERSGPVFKMRNDPRVTRVGRFIRKYSLDELPQLLNVLRGEMSLVGPRPPVPSEVTRYEAWQMRRLSMPPGLTCTWQVGSNRYSVSFQEWMSLDLEYIDNWSLARDIELMLRTIPVVLKGTGIG